MAIPMIGSVHGDFCWNKMNLTIIYTKTDKGETGNLLNYYIKEVNFDEG